MSSILLVLVIFSITTLTPRSSFAAKYHWKFSIDLKEQSLGDQETKISVGDWTCVIGEPKLDSAGSEARRLGCGVGDDLQAYVIPICYKDKKTGKPRSDCGILTLQQRKAGSLQVALLCE